MKLVMLGTGGFLPTDAAQTACYLLPEVGILLDAGSGLYHLPRYLQTSALDVYLSHAHADHTSGLDYVFASFLKWDAMASSVPLSGENIEGFVRRANEFLHRARVHADETTLAVVRPKYHEMQFDWRVLQAQEPLAGNGLLTHFPLENRTVGYRLVWPGHSLAYITDTIARPGASYVEEISHVDVLLHECNGPDHLSGMMEQIGHSHPAAVAQVAAQAQVKRLILIHHSPLETLDYGADLERARRVFPLIEVGHDGMEVDF